MVKQKPKACKGLQLSVVAYKASASSAADTKEIGDCRTVNQESKELMGSEM